MKSESTGKKLSIIAAFIAITFTLYPADCEPDFGDDIYVQWWTDGDINGLLYLLDQREYLFENNLFSTYLDYPENVPCTWSQKKARTIDGTCNDLEKTRMGSAGMRFGRNMPIESTYPDQNLMEPDPRKIARALMERKNGETKEAGHLNYLATAWIQFMLHDWFAHENNPHDFWVIPLDEDDPMYSPQHPNMYIEKSLVDPGQDPSNGLPPAYRNRVTHWWDGSQIYGSDEATNNKIRSFKNGLLKTDSLGALPIDPATGIPVTGFTDNWWVGLAIFHQLFVMEHNAIAKMLKVWHPFWSDQKLYDKARLINAAVMAKIHTLDWTPAILKNPILRQAMEANWNGAYNLGYLLPFSDNEVLSGIIGSTQRHYSAPYSLTEEFTAVYRMNPLLRDSLEVKDYQSNSVVEEVSLENSAFEKATTLMEEHGMTDLFYSFGMTHPGALTTNNYPEFLTNFDVPGPAGLKLDLATLDILRDRERGVPRYNEFRRLLNLRPISDFSQITDDAELVAKLRELYDNDVEKLDALVGQLAEGHRPPGYGFGETAFTIFIAMASRRLQSDRFFTDDYNASTYTTAGLLWIEQADINSVLLRHMPELESKLQNVGNAFFPWDEDSSDW